jgi:hypothetical protein
MYDEIVGPQFICLLAIPGLCRRPTAAFRHG